MLTKHKLENLKNLILIKRTISDKSPLLKIPHTVDKASVDR